MCRRRLRGWRGVRGRSWMCSRGATIGARSASFRRGEGRTGRCRQAAAVAQVRRLVAEGCNEVVLTGVDLASWGEDTAERPGLAALVRTVLREVAELPRLRLSSLDPARLDEGFWAVFGGEERLMPHLAFIGAGRVGSGAEADAAAAYAGGGAGGGGAGAGGAAGCGGGGGFDCRVPDGERGGSGGDAGVRGRRRRCPTCTCFHIARGRGRRRRGCRRCQ